ncbi:Hypothetical predicted protein [Paramuricea clavata]|uniref:Uncharacterized protein n=1 Tax=Paramuricea clavata TaxID=317549 RepID=A0A6S7GGM7_PARCT|nr:Hypothetical predicted protein [Paramuricea clavata]
MDSILRENLLKYDVREETLELLLAEELDTVEMLQAISDELLKACGIKLGQIMLIRKACNPGFASQEHQSCPDPPPQGEEVYVVDATDISELPVTFNVVETISTTKTPIPDVKPVFKSEMATPDEKWLSSFRLPTKFSPGVTAALENKSLTGNTRDKFNRDVCNSIKVHTMNPKKHERDFVAFRIITEYPFLADKIGCGTASWEQSIKNRFKNQRKLKRKANPQSIEIAPPTKQTASEEEAISGETGETCQEHLNALKKEMAKTKNKNFFLIKELMVATFEARRKHITTSPTTLHVLLLDYPGLRLVSEV